MTKGNDSGDSSVVQVYAVIRFIARYINSDEGHNLFIERVRSRVQLLSIYWHH
jgi:hypothetical protein